MTKEGNGIEKMSHPIFDIWNEEAPPEFPSARTLTLSRRVKCEARWKETPCTGEKHYDEKMLYWLDLIRSCKKRPFLTGQNDRGWVMDLKYLIANDTNHVELSEGRFEGKKPGPPTDDLPPYYHFTPEPLIVIGVCAGCGDITEGTREQLAKWVQDKSTCSACYLRSPEYQKSRPGGRSTP